MSEPINDGGPAFPVLNSGYNTVSKKWEPIGPIGMSLRDWLAGQALAGILSNQELLAVLGSQGLSKTSRDYAAIYALACADSVLAAREKGKE